MLGLIESSKGTEAVKCILRRLTGAADVRWYRCDALVTATVRGRPVMVDQVIEVSLTFDGSNFATIDVYWEQSGYVDYRGMGLRGSMSTQWQRASIVGEFGLLISGDGYQVELKIPA